MRFTSSAASLSRRTSSCVFCRGEAGAGGAGGGGAAFAAGAEVFAAGAEAFAAAAAACTRGETFWATLCTSAFGAATAFGTGNCVAAAFGAGAFGAGACASRRLRCVEARKRAHSSAVPLFPSLGGAPVAWHDTRSSLIERARSCSKRMSNPCKSESSTHLEQSNPAAVNTDFNSFTLIPAGPVPVALRLGALAALPAELLTSRMATGTGVGTAGDRKGRVGGGYYRALRRDGSSRSLQRDTRW